MSHRREPHGVPGQLNACVLDVDSEVTSYGKHNRLRVSGSLNGMSITIDEDIRDLPMSSEADRQRVSKGYQRLHPRGTKLVYRSHVQWENGGHQIISYEYDVVRVRKAVTA